MPTTKELLTQHSDYLIYRDKWEKCRVIIEGGEDEVKEKGPLFLPQLGGSDGSDYETYKERASFFNGSGRAKDAYLGLIFRKNPIIKFPENKKVLLDNITINLHSLNIFARKVVSEILTVGRYGILIDSGKEEQSKAYFAGYNTENILNWKQKVINGDMKTTLVVLQETYENDINQFEIEEFLQIRVLFLDEGGTYKVDVYKEIPKRSEKYKISKEKQFELDNTYTPTIVGGSTLDTIPFVFINSLELSTSVTNPPMLDMVNVNISHYRSSADLEHGRHYTALPTAVVTGVDPTEKLYIGSRTAWTIPATDAKVYYLEFKGEGLNTLERALEDKKSDMAVLSARMLEVEKSKVESTDTHKIRKSSEDSTISNIATICSLGISQALKFLGIWEGVQNTDDIDFQLNKDYLNIPISDKSLDQLSRDLSQGHISWDTYFYNLKRGEIYPSGRTQEEELDLITNDPRFLSTITNKNEDDIDSPILKGDS